MENNNIYNSIETKSKELKICNQIKNILMLIIVFYHSCYLWHGDTWVFGELSKYSFSFEDNYILKFLYYFFQPLHTRIFFIISGYIYAFLKLEKKKYPTFKGFAINKFLRLIIPYFFVGLCWLLPMKVFLGISDVKTVLKEVLLGTGADQLWFIIALFWVFLIMYPLDNFIDKHPVWAILLSLVCTGIGFGMLQSPIMINYLYISNALKYIFFFLIGYLLRKYNTGIVRKIKPLFIFIIYCLVFAVSMLLQELDNSVLSNIGLVIYGLLFYIFPELFFGALLNIFDKTNTYDSKLSKFISKHSMQVYLFHQQIIYVVIIIFNTNISPYLLVLLSFAAATLISIGISLLMKTNKVTKFLIGEK